MRNRHSSTVSLSASLACAFAAALRWPALLALAGVAGPGREGRPLQAAERRGRPAGHDRPAEPVVVFNGNVVVTKGTMMIRADRIEVRETPDGYHTAVAIGSPSQHGDLPPEARRRRRVHRGRRRAARVRRQVRHRCASSTTPRCGACAAATSADEITGNLVTYDSTTEVFSVTGGAPATAANPGGRVRAVLTPQGGHRRRRRSGARRQRRGRQRAAALRAGAVARGAAVSAAAGGRCRSHRLEAAGPAEDLRLAQGRRRRAPRGQQRRGGRPARPERRRQDDELLHDRRPGARRRRRDHASTASAVERMPIHQRSRLGLSYLPQEAVDLPQAHRRGEHPRRARAAGRRRRQAAEAGA